MSSNSVTGDVRREGRDALQPWGNGKPKAILGYAFEKLWPVVIALAATYWALNVKVERLEERQANQNAEVLRILDDVKNDLRVLRERR